MMRAGGTKMFYIFVSFCEKEKKIRGNGDSDL
jgi:hypothetical protein